MREYAQRAISRDGEPDYPYAGRGHLFGDRRELEQALRPVEIQALVGSIDGARPTSYAAARRFRPWRFAR
jgi:hypothetical protein